MYLCAINTYAPNGGLIIIIIDDFSVIASTENGRKSRSRPEKKNKLNHFDFFNKCQYKTSIKYSTWLNIFSEEQSTFG